MSVDKLTEKQKTALFGCKNADELRCCCEQENPERPITPSPRTFFANNRVTPQVSLFRFPRSQRNRKAKEENRQKR